MCVFFFVAAGVLLVGALFLTVSVLLDAAPFFMAGASRVVLCVCFVSLLPFSLLLLFSLMFFVFIIADIFSCCQYVLPLLLSACFLLMLSLSCCSCSSPCCCCPLPVVCVRLVAATCFHTVALVLVVCVARVAAAFVLVLARAARRQIKLQRPRATRP